MTIRRISEALDFGHGTISGRDEHPDVLAVADETIRSGEILVPVDRDDSGKALDDDGCGDGRETVEVFNRDRVFKRNLNRPKVFGGAVAMTAATSIGIGVGHNVPLNDVFELAIDTLAHRGINFGAHTDEQAAGESSGCGAIDKASETIFATPKYEIPIRKVITEVVGTLGGHTEGLDEVYDNFRAYTVEIADQEPYSGGKVLQHILDAGKVVKRLGGDHRERRILLNTVRGYTPNQKLIRDATEGRVQAFAVDIPRLEDISNKLFPEDPALENKAFLSMLVYTLSIAAVLTKGDLPVDLIEENTAPVTA